jgi:CHRD domain
MKKLVLAVSSSAVAALIIAGAVALAHGDNGKRSFSAKLNGYNEVTSKSTTGHGRFQARIENGGATIRYKLQYADLETDAQQAHIHFSQRHVNGGISAFLCGGGDKPPCPPRAGTVEGVIDATDVIGPTDQGIEPGSIAELIRAMRHGATYANVHTTRFPGGEIRGQIGKRGDRD